MFSGVNLFLIKSRIYKSHLFWLTSLNSYTIKYWYTWLLRYYVLWYSIVFCAVFKGWLPDNRSVIRLQPCDLSICIKKKSYRFQTLVVFVTAFCTLKRTWRAQSSPDAGIIHYNICSPAINDHPSTLPRSAFCFLRAHISAFYQNVVVCCCCCCFGHS